MKSRNEVEGNTYESNEAAAAAFYQLDQIIQRMRASRPPAGWRGISPHCPPFTQGQGRPQVATAAWELSDFKRMVFTLDSLF